MFFGKNSGYEYDVAKEKEESCNEIVKAIKTIYIYKMPAINYDVIATIQEGMTIKRIKREVNNRNGHIWDKIELSDGTYGYVFSEEIQIVTDVRKLDFKYNEKSYNIYLSQSSFDFKLDNYEYYFVTKENNTELHLYYSNERIQLGSQNMYYRVIGGENSIEVIINLSGTVKYKVVNIKSSNPLIQSSYIIASNQNIYCEGKRIFTKNCGYNYDSANEIEESFYDIVKAIKTINVYEKAAVNYDIIATIQEGLTVKRVKKQVNKVNGHVWDKIELSDGTYGYVFSDEIQTVIDSRKLDFKYNEKSYNIYLSPLSLNMDLSNYIYYCVRKENNTELQLYYSDERIKLDTQGMYYKFISGENAIKITIKLNGTMTYSVMNLKTSGPWINSGEIISSNHNIYCGNTLILKRNCGDNYDVKSETKTLENQIIKPKFDVLNVYDGPGLHYEIIAKVPKGYTIKRIIVSVKEANGHSWDKVELNNGMEGYAMTDEIDWPREITEEGIEIIKTIKIPYNQKIYEAYLELPNLGVNFDEYKYYYAIISDSNKLNVYYSKSEIVTNPYNTTLYETTYGENTIKVEIDMNKGISTYGIIDKGYTRCSWDKYVATNHFGTAKTVSCIICVYDNDLKVIYKDGLNTNDIKRKETILRIIEGEKLYNSMSSTEREKEIDNLKILKADASWAASVSEKLIPNSSKALSYFLTKGESETTDENYLYDEYPFSQGHSMRKLKIDNTMLKDDFNKIADSIINAVENIQNIKDNEVITLSNVPEANGEIKLKSSIDWFATINNYRIKTQSTFIKENDNYTLNLILGVEDYYDWDKKDAQYIWDSAYGLEDIAANRLYELNRAGLARNYTNFGEITYNIQWQKGQRMDSGKVIVTERNN